MKFSFFLTFLFSLIFYQSYSSLALDSTRQVQLDSIVTNITKEIRSDLYLLHNHLHNKGRDDEERVWMFFAVFPTYIKYEKSRMYTKKPKFYTPEYVINKRKGVCRDFSDTFQKLCQLSNIPCIQISGKTPFKVFPFIKSLINFSFPTTRHRWSTVRVKGRWMLMDPTWGSIKEIKKYYQLDRNGNNKTIGKCKIVDRKYYDVSPYLCARYHKPFHPAFYLMKEVPAYKSSFRNTYKPRDKRKLYSSNYDFTAELNKIYENEHPELSKVMETEANKFSKHGGSYLYIKKEMAYDNRMIPRSHKPSLQNYYCHFEELDSLSSYLEKERGYGLDNRCELKKYKYKIYSLYISKLEKKTRNKTRLK